MSIDRRQPTRRMHSKVVLAVLCLFTAIASLAGLGQRPLPMGASAGSSQDQAISRADRALAVQAVARKHAGLDSGGFPPAFLFAGADALPAVAQLSLLLPFESLPAIAQRRSITSAQPRAPPVEASARA